MNDLPPEIAELIERARSADDPSEADQARVGRALALSLGLAPVGWTTVDLGTKGAKAVPSGAAATHALGIASVGTGLKVALVAAIVAAGAGGVLMWRGNTPAAGLHPRHSVESKKVAADAPAVVSPELRSPDSLARSPIRSDAAEMPGSPRATRSSVRHSADIESLASPKAAEIGARQPTSAVRNRQHELPNNNLLAGELSLIAAASQALDSGDARAALRTLEIHKQRFSSGFLTEEREGLWIVALCQAGRVSEAAAARADFDRRAPRSPLRRRIATQCETGANAP